MSKIYTPTDKIKIIQWIDCMKYGIKSVNQVGLIGNFSDFLFDTKGFYRSTYCCPECQRYPLYKIKTHGLESTFRGSKVFLYNVFTFPNCKRFLASILNADLSDGWTIEESSKLSTFSIYSYRHYLDEYYKIVEDIDDAYHNFSNHWTVVGNNIL